MPLKQWERRRATIGAVTVHHARRFVCPGRFSPCSWLHRVCIRLRASNSICTGCESCCCMTSPSCKTVFATTRAERCCCLARSAAARCPLSCPVPRRHHRLLRPQVHAYLPLRVRAPVQLRIRRQFRRRLLRATCPPQGHAPGNRSRPLHTAAPLRAQRTEAGSVCTLCVCLCGACADVSVN